MKSLKIILSAIALAAAVATPTLRAADETAPAARKQHGMNVENQVARIDQDAGGLTAEQKTKIKDILTANAEKMHGATTKEERQAIGKEQREAIRAVLTPEQQQKLTAAQKENAGKAKAKGKKKNQE